MSASWPPDAWAGRPIHCVGDLALFLGGSDDSFTGELLRLMMKADRGNRRHLAAAFPREDAALVAWEQLSPLTFGELARVPGLSDLPREIDPCPVCDSPTGDRARWTPGRARGGSV